MLESIQKHKRILKWVSVVFLTIATAFGVWIALFIFAFFHAMPKYQEINKGDMRANIEASKGLLYAREVDPSFLGGYRNFSPFRELIAKPGTVIVGYSLFGAGFTVIYDEEGKVLAVIDNKLDG